MCLTESFDCLQVSERRIVLNDVIMVTKLTMSAIVIEFFKRMTTDQANNDF